MQNNSFGGYYVFHGNSPVFVPQYPLRHSYSTPQRTSRQFAEEPEYVDDTIARFSMVQPPLDPTIAKKLKEVSDLRVSKPAGYDYYLGLILDS